MAERQQTGLWFIVTGILILSFWFFAYHIVNWSINSEFLALDTNKFSDDQQYTIGASAVVTVKLISLIGIPFLITGIAQILGGMKKAKKSPKK